MGMFRMLVATDGLEYGEHAVTVARSLVNHGPGELEVLTVETAGIPDQSWGPPVRRDTPTSATTWSRGIPGVEIVRHAEQWRADVVVLGRHPRSVTEPFRLGPTSDVVIRRRHGPSLFIPPSISAIRRVVIALDGTHRGLGVLEAAASLVEMTGADPTSVLVLPGGDLSDTSGDPRVIRVRQSLGRFQSLGGAAQLRVLRGDPVAQVLGFLAEVKGDLLVLGVRGGGPTGEMGSGHVGRDLLQTAAVAILSIPI